MNTVASYGLNDTGHQSDWLVRMACPDDLNSLVQLEQTCFATPWTEQSLRSDLENSSVARYWVAESRSAGVIGYIACYQAADTAQITNLAVLPDFRHQGVGEQLLATLLGWALDSQIATVDLEVRSSNESAIRLYQKMGFAKVGVRRAYYTDNNEDANIMLKNIP